MLRIRFVLDGLVFRGRGTTCLHWRVALNHAYVSLNSEMRKQADDVLVFYRDGKLFVLPPGEHAGRSCQHNSSENIAQWWLCLDEARFLVQKDESSGVSLEQAFKTRIDKIYSDAWDADTLVRWGDEYDRAIDLPVATAARVAGKRR